MKQAKNSKQRKRFKAAGIAAVAFAVGVGLLVLSQLLFRAGQAAAAQSQPATATATAPTPPHSPGEPLDTPGRTQPTNPKAAASARLGSLLLLFSLMGFGVGIISIGWIVYDIRQSRPAWKTQKKYPIRERRK